MAKEQEESSEQQETLAAAIGALDARTEDLAKKIKGQSVKLGQEVSKLTARIDALESQLAAQSAQSAAPPGAAPAEAPAAPPKDSPFPGREELGATVRIADDQYAGRDIEVFSACGPINYIGGVAEVDYETAKTLVESFPKIHLAK